MSEKCSAVSQRCRCIRAVAILFFSTHFFCGSLYVRKATNQSAGDCPFENLIMMVKWIVLIFFWSTGKAAWQQTVARARTCYLAAQRVYTASSALGPFLSERPGPLYPQSNPSLLEEQVPL